MKTIDIIWLILMAFIAGSLFICDSSTETNDPIITESLYQNLNSFPDSVIVFQLPDSWDGNVKHIEPHNHCIKNDSTAIITVSKYTIFHKDRKYYIAISLNDLKFNTRAVDVHYMIDTNNQNKEEYLCQ